MKPLKIRIVVGSLAGLFADILSQRDGHDVKIYERSTSGLARRGAGLVGQQDLFRVLSAIEREDVADVDVVARERIYFEADGRGGQMIPTPQAQISWDYLHETIASLLTAYSYSLGRSVDRMTEGARGAMLWFPDGANEEADLVIGADGIGSVVRGTLNRNAQNAFAGYVAWRGLVPETALSTGTFVLLDRFAFYVTHGIHVLGYLVPGPKGETEKGRRRYNWVWYRPMSELERRKEFTGKGGHLFEYSLPRGEFSDERRALLREDAFALLPPPFALAIQTEEEPSIQGIFDYAERTASGHIVLVGDAAFVVRPHTAMGVSKAAGDVLALRRALLETDDIHRAVIRYEEERLPVGREIAAYGRLFAASAL